MESICQGIYLHPKTQEYLFQHYRAIRQIFRDVLGHLEIDYLSIAILNIHGQLLFFSSKPNIEQNLIEHNLWQNDPCLQAEFFAQKNFYIWNTIYQEDSMKSLKYYRMEKNRLNYGISIPTVFDKYKLNYSFALHSINEKTHSILVNKIDTLVDIGQFCLKKIMNIIPISEKKEIFIIKQPFLKLIINNEITHEKIT